MVGVIERKLNGVRNRMNYNMELWTPPTNLLDFVMSTLFEQPRLDSTALVWGKYLDGSIHTWMLTANHYQPITEADYAQFKRAAKLRGGSYSLELCEFTVEEVLADGSIYLNYWRRVADDTGEGGRAVLERDGQHWRVAKKLGGWRNGLKRAQV